MEILNVVVPLITKNYLSEQESFAQGKTKNIQTKWEKYQIY